MIGPRPSMPGRDFVFHPDDAHAWSELMRRRFPQLRYYDEPRSTLLRPDQALPELHLRTALRGGDDEGHRSIGIALDESWRPTWKERRGASGEAELIFRPPPYPNARIQFLGGRIFESATVKNGKIEPPRITGGQIYFRCEKGEPEHMRVARAALRLIAKVATNKVAVVHYPSLKVVPQKGGGPGVTWCGFHALDWSRKAPDRFLDYRPTMEGNEGYGLRPMD